jgi:hypothetical protein
MKIVLETIEAIIAVRHLADVILEWDATAMRWERAGLGHAVCLRDTRTITAGEKCI